MLGAIQGRIGAFRNQTGIGIGIRLQGKHALADGDAIRHVGKFVGDVLVVEQAFHALGRADRIGKLGPRQNHHKFLTAVARHDLADAPRRGALHQRAHPPQHLIAGRVAVVVVVLLEVIHVDEYDREPGAAAPGATDLIAQHLVDDATVAKARQFVDIGQVR